MFYSLSGTISHIEASLVVVECGGVGYLCHSTSTSISKMKVREQGFLYTHLNVREDAMDLYGFATLEEKHLFLQLISVSGVGPKAALAMLSGSSPEHLALAIITEDEKALTIAPGIGKKIAQRVILELKDKLAKGQTVSFVGSQVEMEQCVTVIPQNKRSEATAALAVLGYAPLEITMALQGIDIDGFTLEEIIKQALKKMMKK